MSTSPKDFPLDVILQQVTPLIRDGATIFMKFTCSNCGSRQTCEEPNKLFKQASCEECGHITNIEETGCGYILVMSHYGEEA